QRLGELSHAVNQTQEIAKQNLELKRDVATLREQLDALDVKLRERKPAASSPSPSPQDKWCFDALYENRQPTCHRHRAPDHRFKVLRSKRGGRAEARRFARTRVPHEPGGRARGRLRAR